MLYPTPLFGPNRWASRLFTLVLAGAAAASAVYWVLQWPDKASSSLPGVSATPPAAIDSQQLALLLGAPAAADSDQAPTAAPSNVQLLGVIALGSAGSQGQGGSALLAIAGSSAKPYRVGDEVADGLVLQAVKRRSVVLGRAGQTQGLTTLELPLLPGMSDQP